MEVMKTKQLSYISIWRLCFIIMYSPISNNKVKVFPSPSPVISALLLVKTKSHTLLPWISISLTSHKKFKQKSLAKEELCHRHKILYAYYMPICLYELCTILYFQISSLEIILKIQLFYLQLVSVLAVFSFYTGFLHKIAKNRNRTFTMIYPLRIWFKFCSANVEIVSSTS